MAENKIACGKFLKPFGVRGEIRFDPYLSENLKPESLKEGVAVPPQDSHSGSVNIKIAEARHAQGFWIIRPEGINSPEEAKKFTHWELLVERSCLEPLEEGEYLHQDVIGCAIIGEDGVEIGVVKKVLPTGANDVWEVELPDGGEVLLPVIKDVVLSIDTENKKISVRMMDGLMD